MARGTMHAPKPEGQQHRTNTPAHGEREAARRELSAAVRRGHGKSATGSLKGL